MSVWVNFGGPITCVRQLAHWMVRVELRDRGVYPGLMAPEWKRQSAVYTSYGHEMVGVSFVFILARPVMNWRLS